LDFLRDWVYSRLTGQELKHALQLIWFANGEVISGLDLRCKDGMCRQKQSACRLSLQGFHFGAGIRFNFLSDSTLFIEVNQIEEFGPLCSRNPSVRFQPKARVGPGSKVIKELFKGLRSSLEELYFQAEEPLPGPVVYTESSSGRHPPSPILKRSLIEFHHARGRSLRIELPGTRNGWVECPAKPVLVGMRSLPD
jgi:hypothetical protein